MRRVFNNKIWVMDRYTFEYWQYLSRQWQGVEKNGILLQIEKAADTTGGDLTCHVFSLEDAVAHLSFTNPNGILTIENNKIKLIKMESHMSENFWIYYKLKNHLLV